MPTKVDAQISVKCAQMPLVLDGLFFHYWCDNVHLKGQSKKNRHSESVWCQRG